MSEHKRLTAEAYDRYSKQFDAYFDASFEKRVRPQAQRFVDELPQGAAVLDLGSGSGNHAKFFQEQGLSPRCADLSEEMVKRCREKGLQADVMDMEHLAYSDASFDGVWAYASMIHLKREAFPGAIAEVTRVLKPKGIFGLSMKEGEYEELETSAQYPDTQRFFVYHPKKEVDLVLATDFVVINFVRQVASERSTFLSYLLRKRT